MIMIIMSITLLSCYFPLFDQNVVEYHFILGLIPNNSFLLTYNLDLTVQFHMPQNSYLKLFKMIIY